MAPFRITVTALTLIVAVPRARPADEPPNREAKTLGGHTGTVRVLHAPRRHARVTPSPGR